MRFAGVRPTIRDSNWLALPSSAAMRRISTIVTALALALGAGSPVQPHATEFTDSPVQRQIKWPTRTIAVAFSTSLRKPGSNIKPGSDVVGAARRALSRWSTMSNLRFVESFSRALSLSPTSGGDGISLITIADTPENNALFGGEQEAGRTRVFYDDASGAIIEADIVLNPHPFSAEGAPLQFSTDGTPGTFDLESTFTHELGHLLGLGHSNVVAATMQSRQGVNGIYQLPALTERTLSEDDRARVRSLYGPWDGSGAIEGKLLNGFPGGDPTPLAGAHVWVENLISGRVVASASTAADGSFQIGSVPPGEYRVLSEPLKDPGSPGLAIPRQVFRSAEISSQVNVKANATSALSHVLTPPQSTEPSLRPRLIGMNGELSTTPVVAAAGEKITVYVGGEALDQVPASGFSVMSPFLTIDPGSIRLQQFGTSFPVVGFDLTVAPNIPFGDYSLKLQLNSGEAAYIAGGITIDPGVESASPNPADDARFFIGQHYRDFLGREADQYALDEAAGKIARCGSDSECVRARRLDASAAFLIGTEFPETGFFIYRFYKSALGRRPTLAEFDTDNRQIAAYGADLQAGRRAFARSFVLRPEFLEKYWVSQKADQFVSFLLEEVLRVSGVDLSSERTTLTAQYDGTSARRAEIIQGIADNPSFARREYSRAFVLMQYFGYLRREPDDEGYNFWFNSLNTRMSDPTAHRALVCAFITSAEFQSRFGMLVTRTDRECKP